jgi:Flp pilus assembly protein TadB
MARRGDLRASDADREQVTERLRRAASEGRLLAHELEHRLATALRARTYGELDAVVADLPGDRLEGRRGHTTVPWRPALALAIAIPVAVALVAVVVVIVTGFIAVWMLWALVGWWILGRRRGYPGRRHVRGGARPVGMYGARRAPAPRTGFWL